MANKFYVDEVEDDNIVIKEGKGEHSKFVWFLINNGNLILTIAILFSISISIVSLSLFLRNVGESTIITYEDNGVVVKFNGTDNSNIGGVPITDEYANSLFDDIILDKDKDNKKIMDIKEIKLENTNSKKMNYIVVLEETNNYGKHDIDKVLPSDNIKYNIYVNNNKYYNRTLNNNLKDNKDYSFGNNTYLLHEGVIESNSNVELNIGMWISYNEIVNEYMDSTFIGTIKVYVE